MKKRKSSKRAIGTYSERELAKIIQDFNQKVDVEVERIIQGKLI
jgi:hypothetical protein